MQIQDQIVELETQKILIAGLDNAGKSSIQDIMQFISIEAAKRRIPSEEIELLNEEYMSIVGFLNESTQPSLSSDVNKSFKKIIVLSSASYFEHLIQGILIDFVTKETRNNLKAVHFFKKKAIGMQFHTYFNWGEKDNPDKPGKSANSFFALFGDDFKKEVEAEIKNNPSLDKSMKAFIEIGHLRNILVHSNFAAYNLDNKTADEIYDLYKTGLPFVDYVRDKLTETT